MPPGLAGLQGLPTIRIYTPTPPPPFVCVFLDSVTIIDDEDPGGPGEIQLTSVVATGNTAQSTRFPTKLWYEANDGNTIPVKQPIFALPEDRMGEFLGITVTAIDDDTPPDAVGWVFEDIIPFVVGQVVSWVTGGTPGVGTATEMVAEEVGEAIVEEIGGAERIGTYAKAYPRGESWGIRNQVYEFRAGNMIARYYIRRVEAIDRPVELRLRPITIHDDGDDWTRGEGDIFVWVRTADKFVMDQLSGERMRIPGGRHTVGKDDGEVFGEKWGNQGITIFDTHSEGPFLYFEVGVWDQYDPGVDAHDMLGIFSGWVSGEYLEPEPFSWVASDTVQGIDEGKVTIALEIIVE